MTDATSSSLLRPANQKPMICYCKSGECSAPKPEWCIGRRYADGFREANTERVAEHSTPAMRTRIRELARPNSDDYDRAVIAVLDDFEAALAQSNAGPNETYNRSLVAQADAAELASYKKLVYIIESEIKRRDQLQAAGEIYTAQSRPDASVALDEIEAGMDRVLERRGFQTTRPDASAGLIEAAGMAEEYASKHCYDNQAEQGLLRNFAQFLRTRAANRSGKP